MHGLTFQGREQIRYDRVPDPRLESPRDVIVKIDLAAICGSDLHPYFEREKGLDHGTVMGHEAVGTVVDAGVESGWNRGDRVFTPFTTNCGACFYCTTGLTCRCTRGQLFGWVERGRGLPGLQAEHARIPLADSTLMAVPDGVRAEDALLLGDVLSTGYFAAVQAGVQAGGTYVVVGAGPVGLMAVVGARELGAERIFSIDPVPERRALAARFGAEPIAPDAGHAIEMLRDATDGRGADGVLETVGSRDAARLAFDLLRPGGVLSTVGVHTDPTFPFTPADAYNKNLTYRVGRCPARYYMERLVPLVQSEKYDLSLVFSHRLPLASGAEAYRLFAARTAGCTKVILTP
jgi:threonine dehydrogenase-like Zn-dependent dehydrogenase